MDKEAELRQWLELADYEKCTILSGFAVQSRYPNEIRVSLSRARIELATRRLRVCCSTS